MRSAIIVRCLLFSLLLLVFSHGASAQIGVAISVNFGPPPIPVYEQPICPADGYIWTPGYWAYDDVDGYYWVPGTWVEPPEVGFLWTPGYWGWGDGVYVFHEGYWGPEVGFYGGINYGFGYFGAGYEGGRWEGGHFAYNTYVNHVNTTIIHNTYNTRVNVVSDSHVSFNGGEGGIQRRPSSQEESYARGRHVVPVAAQEQHVQAARGNPELRASTNHGKPAVAATTKPGDFRTGAVAAREAGGEYKAPPANGARGNEARTGGNEVRGGNETRTETTNRGANEPAANGNHASGVQPHTYTPPNSGNVATDKKYQQQQEKLATQQNQEHQKLQQQQEREHQQATQKNYNDAQRQQMEQRHTQQTQQMEQRHVQQQTQIEQRQAPHQAAPKGNEKH